MLTFDSPYVRRGVRTAPRLRLVCLPYAGAGASIYQTWPDLLPDDIEVLAIQLPGREDRKSEPGFLELDPLVQVLGEVIRPYLQVPVALFGHCAGSLLAYELAGELRDHFGVLPRHLFVSAQPAPHLRPRNPPMHALPDEEFRAAVVELGGAPPDVLAADDLFAYLLGGLRADFALWERYAYQPRPPIDCPITAFGGDQDERATITELAEWHGHTTGRLRLQIFAGGHFFITQRAAEVAGKIVEALAPTALAGRLS